MFTIDEKIRGIPATSDQVVALHQSLNSPHLAIPGKRAGPAQAFLLGARASSGYAAFIYLFLPDVGDCAVYVSDRRAVGSINDYRAEEADAMAFLESMGFMMDNLNFIQLPPARQAELVRTLPLFQKDPKRLAGTAAGAEEAKQSRTASLARLFASF